MNQLKARIKSLGEAVRIKLPKNRDAEVASLTDLTKRQSNEIASLQRRLDQMDREWKTDLDSLMHCQKRVEEMKSQLDASRETFQQATIANEQLADLVSSLREQIRELQAREASTRTVKAVWDAADSLMDLTAMVQDRIKKFRSTVGHAYSLNVTEKN